MAQTFDEWLDSDHCKRKLVKADQFLPLIKDTWKQIQLCSIGNIADPAFDYTESYDDEDEHYVFCWSHSDLLLEIYLFLDGRTEWFCHERKREGPDTGHGSDGNKEPRSSFSDEMIFWLNKVSELNWE